ncbi:MAG: acyltransferase family protein [Sphingobium sp.]
MTIGSEVPVQPNVTVPRHYGLDWLRIGAFLLLMLYHAGMVFVTGDWIVKTAHPIQWLAYPMLFITPWRLTVLFIVSGYASRALLVKLKGTKRFARERTTRLIIPLLFAMAVIIPPQSWVNLRFNHGYTHDFGHFIKHDWLMFGQYDHVTLPGWEHLWFVFYLWFFTMLLAAGLLLLREETKAKLAGMFETLGTGSRLLWLPLVYFVPVRVAVTFTTGESHGLFDDWLTDVIHFPAFLFGFGLAGSRAVWPAFARVWRPALALALASFAVLVAVETAYPGTMTPPHGTMALNRAALACMMWSMALVMIHAATVLLNRDHPWRARLSEAVFPFYIIHQTAIVMIAWWLLPLALPPIAEALIIIAGTALSCVLFYGIAGRIAWLRPLIGLRR